MRVGKVIKFGCLGVLGVLIVAAIGIWIWKPWSSMVPALMSDPSPIGQRIEQGELLANYYPVEGTESGPGILLIGGSEGALGAEMTRLAKALNAEGFSVLHQSYWRAPGQAQKLERIPLERFMEGLRFLRSRSEVDAENVAMMGWSRGSEATQLVAIRDPQLKAIVLGMPGSAVYPGFSWEAPWATFESAWTWKGKDLPFLDFSDLGSFFSSAEEFKETKRQILKRQDEFPETNIPVEEAQSAVLLICGGRDVVWDSCPMARRQIDRLEAAGREDAELLSYEDAGHLAFGAPIEPDDPAYAQLSMLGGTVEANTTALDDAFPKMVAFLKRNLNDEGD
ncbi:MAG: acyl-CoA thioester hydrolase/BAAT C-terminal domain-containing protein [Erythrobacter sp.]